MKKNFNNADLIRKDVDPKYFLFYQLWLELTDEKTLDWIDVQLMTYWSKDVKKCVNWQQMQRSCLKE